MFICYGPPDDRIERCLSFDEKPLPIFRELKRTSKQPVIKLKHLKDLRSPVTIAQQKYAARKVTRTASSTFTLNYHPNLNSEPSRLVLYAIASVSNTSPNVESPRQIISSGSGENHRGNERKVSVSRQDLGFCVAIYPYMARQMDEFDVVVGGTFVIISRAPGWWLVQRDPQGTGAVNGDPSKQGWIPTGCLLETRIPIAYAATSTSTNSLNFSSTTQSSSIDYTSRRIDAYTPILPQCFVTASVPCYAIVEYKKRNAEEVELSKDETLRVFKRYKHWTYVVKDDGQRGWVPSWYIGKSAVLVQLPDGISSPGGVSGSGGEDDASPTLDSTIGALPLRRAMDERECVGGVTAYMDVCTMMEFPPRRKGIGMSAHRQCLCRLCATCVESPEHALLICTSSEALVATRVSFLLQLSLLWPGFKPPVDDDDASNALRALVEEKEVRGVLGTFVQEVFLIFDAV
ncbi:hypothetical protein PENSPDRAFT_613063 [Peniophora sp. CONT]|nr:hypothetical protein PENSPDRAFT_613063 [Peniophora sp. CONT]